MIHRKAIGTIVLMVGIVGGLSAQTACAAVLYAWGWNVYGQVGDGTTGQEHDAPVPVSGMGSGVSAIAAGRDHSFAVQNGAIYAWGNNSYGQLGDGTQNNHFTPAAVTGMGSGVTALAGGAYHSLAVQNGAVYAWGLNASGDLGDGTTTARYTPVPVTGLTSGITIIAAAGYHSLAVDQSGTLYAWGYNGFGQLGDGSTTDHYTPVVVSGMASGVTAIAAGGNHHSLAVQNGALYAWGNNGNGQLGDGTTTDHHSPFAVLGLGSGVTSVAAGLAHSLAVKNGAVYAWGYNGEGQLGDGTTTENHTPTLVSGLSDITDVAASIVSSFALAGDGRLWAWGLNSQGELGLGDTIDRLTPTEVFAPTGYKFTSIDSDGFGQTVLATVVAVPEPGTLSILAIGGLMVLHRRTNPRARAKSSTNQREVQCPQT